jgi:hypothetical protein
MHHEQEEAGRECGIHPYSLPFQSGLMSCFRVGSFTYGSEQTAQQTFCRRSQ